MNKEEALTYLEQYQATSVDKDSNLDKALNEAIFALHKLRELNTLVNLLQSQAVGNTEMLITLCPVRECLNSNSITWKESDLNGELNL